MTPVAAPDLSSLSIGQASVEVMRALEFSQDGRWLLVRTTFVDDVAPAALRDVVSLYDVEQQVHTRIYNGLLGSGHTVDIQHAALAWVGQQAVVLAAYATQGPGGGPSTRVARFVDGALQSVDVVEAITGEVANAAIESLALSQDGRYLALATVANNLTPELDTNDVSDIYLFDLQSSTVRRVSVLADGVTESPLPATLGDVRSLPDGSVAVSFSTAGATLADKDSNGAEDVFVWQLATGATTATITLASRNPQGKASAGASQSSLLSDAGLFFGSTASDLVADDGNGVEDVFLRGWSPTTVARVSASTGLEGAELDGASALNSVSGEGRYLVWTSDAPAIGTEPGVAQVLIRDRVTGAVSVVSKASTNALGNDLSLYALVSGNGQRVALTTYATNLAPPSEDLGALLLVGDNPVADKAAAGTLQVTGAANEGGSLTVSLVGVVDADGPTTTTYRWEERIDSTWTSLSGNGADTATLTVPSDQSFVGKVVRAVATTTDVLGGTTLFESSAQTIVNVNDAPIGAVTISGLAAQGQVLTASNTLADQDGIPSMGTGAISYQWKANGTLIAGATGSTFTLTEAEVNKTLTVTASYVDSQGTPESVSSAATPMVAAANPLNGMVYHWKSHMLLSGVSVGVSSAAAVQANTTDLFDLRAAAFNASTGVLSVEVWANPSAGFGSFDFTASTVGATAASFVSALPTNWEVTANVANPQSVQVGGISLTNLATTTRLGTLQINLSPATTIAQVDFSNISVGSVTGAAQALNMQGRTTGTDGAYSFTTAPASPSMTASRAANDSGSAITSADALAALRIAVGLNPNPDPDGTGPKTAPAVSPYQIMAADVNGSGTVTSADALAILRMAVKLSTALPQEWFFVEEMRDFWNETANAGQGAFTLNRGSAAWDRAILVGPTTAGPVNLVAVLKGDVNGSWSAPTGSSDLDVVDPNYFQRLAQLIGLPNQDQWGGGP